MSGIFLGERGSREDLGNWIHDNGKRVSLDHGVYWSLGTKA